MQNKTSSTIDFISSEGDLVAFSHISFNEEGIACLPESPIRSNQYFDVKGIRFYAQLQSDMKKGYFTIWGGLGKLPYSAENPETRKILLHILRRSREQDKVNFMVTKDQNIIVAQQRPVSGKVTPLNFLSNVYGFLYEALPLALLISQYINVKTKKKK